MLMRGAILFFAILWFSAATAPVSARPGPVLVLGDSLSAAYGLRSDDGWVSLLQERLQQAASPREVVNASISGETTAGGLGRLPKLLTDHEPALV
ncbi:MAG: GDSL-type esterase/lipase family protein, partial [Dokdonella sp.]